MTTTKAPKINIYTKDPMVRKALLSGPRVVKEKDPPKPAVKKDRIWAVDFDGTLCQNNFPKIGKPNTELIEALLFAKQCGVKLILWTCRSGEALAEALEWCGEQGLSFDAVNENLPSMIDLYGNDPRKIAATLYIDDRAFPWWGNGEKGDLCKLAQTL